MIPIFAADLDRQARDLVQVVAQLRLALLERLQQCGGRLVADGRALVAVLLRVQALVRDPHRRDGVATFVGDHGLAGRASDLEARAALGERLARVLGGLGAPSSRVPRTSTQNSSPPRR